MSDIFISIQNLFSKLFQKSLKSGLSEPKSTNTPERNNRKIFFREKSKKDLTNARPSVIIAYVPSERGKNVLVWLNGRAADL